MFVIKVTLNRFPVLDERLSYDSLLAPCESLLFWYSSSSFVSALHRFPYVPYNLFCLMSFILKCLFIQRRHALRCYCQAMQVYKGRGWSLAEDHINFTIGRQSFTLGQPENAVQAFRQILTNDSRQTPTQQSAFLREYVYVYKVTTVCNHVSIKHVDSINTLIFFWHFFISVIRMIE